MWAFCNFVLQIVEVEYDLAWPWPFLEGLYNWYSVQQLLLISNCPKRLLKVLKIDNKLK